MSASLPLAPLTRLEHAELRWDDDVAFAAHFDDVYFSREDGRQETEHVFIKHNQLPERFAVWQNRRPFVIGETGLGSGLNMLCAWTCFETYAPSEARLHLVSFERFPLCRDDLQRMLSAWPALKDKAQRLIQLWPQPVLGVHRLPLSDRVTLDIHLGDVIERLGQCEGRIDAWFLDGFAPSKNPDMWQPALYDGMARASRPGATFATFTSAGEVRRGLKAAGFECQKVEGFGRKREMVCGSISVPPADRRRQRTPWYIPSEEGDIPQHVAVVGAGIAGTSTAHALARRGIRVSLIDPKTPGSEGSGNLQGAMYVKLAVNTNLQSRFYLSTLLYIRRLLDSLDPKHTLWHDCGVLSLATTEKEAQRQRHFLANHSLPDTVMKGLSAHEVRTLVNTTLPDEVYHGLLSPLAGWVRPYLICETLAATPGVTHYRHAMTDLTAKGKGWTVTLDDGSSLAADAVVMANAWRANRIAPLAHLPLMPIRGQVSNVPVKEGTPSPACVVCASGYAPPALHGRQCFGATFSPRLTDDSLIMEDHLHNVDELQAMLPDCADALTAQGWKEAMEGKAGIRCASPDKSPFVGQAPIAEQWQHDYAGLADDAKRFASDVAGHYHPNLWLSVAQGSRGMVGSPLCAELLASRICHEPLPLEMAIVDHLQPGRRLIADLKRSKS